MELLYVQLRTFLAMLLYGFLAAFLFYTYQKLIKKFHVKKTLLHILDLFFCLFTAVAGFLLLFYINQGSFRFYVILAIFLGICLYILLKNKLKYIS